MLGAGLLARKAVEAGLTRRPWVKTSLAPGLEGRHRVPGARGADRAARAARLLARRLRLHDVHRQLRAAAGGDLARDRRARPDRLLGAVGQPQLRGAHPPRGQDELPRQPAAVRGLRAGGADGHRHHARAAAGRRAPGRHLAVAARGEPTRSSRRSSRTCSAAATARCSPATRTGTAWRCRPATATPGIRSRPTSSARRTSTAWPPSRRAGSSGSPARGRSRCWATASRPTTSRPPARSRRDSPAGRYLVEHGVERRDFNSYGSRRGNHEVMMRGTFANVRLRNQLAPGTEGGVTIWDGEQTTIYDAAMTAAEQGVPLCVLAGEEYGSGSSRDWAAKGPNLLGIRFVLAQSYERIHRSNLVGMGVLPLQFPDGESVDVARPHRRARRSTSRRSRRGRTTLRVGDLDGRRVRRARAHRHAQRVALLPPRRDPALRPAPAAGATLTARGGRAPAPLSIGFAKGKHRPDDQHLRGPASSAAAAKRAVDAAMDVLASVRKPPRPRHGGRSTPRRAPR